MEQSLRKNLTTRFGFGLIYVQKRTEAFYSFSFPVGPQKETWHSGAFEGIYLPPVSPLAWSKLKYSAGLFSHPEELCKKYVKTKKKRKHLECKSKRILLDMKDSVEYLIRLASFTPLRLRFASSLLAFWVIPLSFSPVLYLPLSLTFTQLISRHGSSRGKYHCP